MKRKLLAVAGGALLAASLPNYAGVPGPSVSGNVDLEFGTVAADNDASGQLTIAAADGSKSESGTVYAFGGLTGVQAEYLVTGLTVGDTYLIQLPSSLDLVGGNSGHKITVDNLQSQPSTSFIATSDKATILVGGTASLAANQAGDTYSAPLSITVTPQTTN